MLFYCSCFSCLWCRWERISWSTGNFRFFTWSLFLFLFTDDLNNIISSLNLIEFITLNWSKSLHQSSTESMKLLNLFHQFLHSEYMLTNSLQTFENNMYNDNILIYSLQNNPYNMYSVIRFNHIVQLDCFYCNMPWCMQTWAL